MRWLADGELRLAIHCFELAPADLPPAQRRPVPPWPRAADAWQPVPVTGIAVVIESRAASTAVGLVMRARVHVGTHRVVSAAMLALEGFDVLGSCRGAGGRFCGEGCGWHTDGCQSGPDAVEHAITMLRDGTHADRRPGHLSLSLRASSDGARAPITDASCCTHLLRRAIPDSSTGRRAT